MYSYLAFPDMRDDLLTDEVLVEHFEDVRRRTTDERAPLRLRWNRSFFRELRALHTRLFDRYDWSDYALVGFTLNYGQTVASLYAAREIKKRNPRCKVIVGGAEGTGQVGASLVEHFDEIDYACNGEGERPLVELVKLLRATGGEPRLPQLAAVGGLIYENHYGAVLQNRPNQVADLSTLPTPDYDEYFAAIEGFGVPEDEIVSCLPIEASRGCYHACSFCALTAQWETFRNFGAEQVARTMDELSSRHKILEFFFVDNITPTNCEEIFERVAQSGKDYGFFYEARANLPRRTFEIMKKAGLERVQIGIEALSTSMLRKFHKKAKVIHNIQAMKNCEELEILMSANLITNHFLSSARDIEETVEAIEYCTAYFPPNGSSTFALVMGAPDYEQGEQRGYELRGNASFYRRNWPEPLFQSLQLPMKDFEPLGEPVDWSGIEERVAQWKRDYFEFKRDNPTNQKMLVYYDGGDFLRIEDRRPGLESTHVLDATERGVYLLSKQIKPLTAFGRALGHLPPGRVAAIVDDLVARKLMYREGDFVLSLAMTPTPRFEASEGAGAVSERGSRAHLRIAR
ncbi:MAG: radical SAM protein [Nannocystaceae bacterium]